MGGAVPDGAHRAQGLSRTAGKLGEPQFGRLCALPPPTPAPAPHHEPQRLPLEALRQGGSKISAVLDASSASWGLAKSMASWV